MLFRWQLLNKRLELLGAVKTSPFIRTPPQNLDMRFGARRSCELLGSANTWTDIQPACGQCGHGRSSDDDACSTCGNHQVNPRCSVCRLPVKGKFSIEMQSLRSRPLTGSLGLARSCGQCSHVTHVKCWRDQQSNTCGTGCGCPCRGLNPGLKSGFFVRSPAPISVPLV